MPISYVAAPGDASQAASRARSVVARHAGLQRSPEKHVYQAYSVRVAVDTRIIRIFLHRIPLSLLQVTRGLSVLSQQRLSHRNVPRSIHLTLVFTGHNLCAMPSHNPST
jgi:hypothetical protein